MLKILYTKFSNERAPEFAIQTQIVETSEGKKYVIKKAADQRAEKHILQLSEWEKILETKYANSLLKINHQTEIDGQKVFEFVEGRTLESVLDEQLRRNNIQAVCALLKQYISCVYKANSDMKFAVTGDFEKVFGNVQFDIPMKCSSVSNIDMIPSNVKIVNDLNWTILDYEWTFAFPIPAKYIVYRIIHYYVEGAKERNILKEYDIYRQFDIASDEEKVFSQMEDHFQQYILGEMIPIRHMYNGIVKNAYDLDYTLIQAKERKNYSTMQIYWDRGDGYSEQDSFLYEPKMDPYGVIHLNFNVPKGVKNVRIDPAGQACVVALGDVFGDDGALYRLKVLTNGIMDESNLILFLGNDPQICLEGLKENTSKVCLEIEISMMYDSLSEKVQTYVERKAHEYSTLQSKYFELEHHYLTAMSMKAELEKQVADLNHRLYIAESNFHAIQGTFAWKMTKPFRKTMDILKKLLGRNPKTKIFLKSCKVWLRQGAKTAKQYYANELESWKTRHIQEKVNRFVDADLYEKQRKTVFDKKVTFSIIVPLFNTPEEFLYEMIESVLAQTYTNWELCMADGSDRKHNYVRKICNEYRKMDKRIRYKRIRQNLGISGNTNVALRMASGNYITLFDHDDFLHPSALFETMKMIEQRADYIYSDEAVFSESMFENVTYHYKPDFAPDTFRGVNYICHLSSFSAELLHQVGEFRTECDGSQDYDLMLRLTEKAQYIAHIPKVLYYWRSHAASVASGIGAKMYALEGAHVALRDHLKRIGLKGEVLDAAFPSTYRIKYELTAHPLVSIVIPNKDHIDDLDKCISSITEKTTYRNYEIVVIENNSEDAETFEYYKRLEKSDYIRVVNYEGGFNYSAINNFGVKYTQGEYLVLLNNDIEVITPEWIEEMLMYAQRKDVGAVGPMLYYADDTIQHAGLIIGIGGSAGHSHKGFPRGHNGYLCKLCTVQNFSGVTGACLMIRKDIYNEVHGLDEQFAVAFNDVDFCLRVREAGYLNVFTPFAELYHYESKSRGYEDTPEKQKRFEGERNLLRKRWKKIIIEKGDPYYNPNLTLDREDFGVK